MSVQRYEELETQNHLIADNISTSIGDFDTPVSVAWQDIWDSWWDINGDELQNLRAEYSDLWYDDVDRKLKFRKEYD